MTGDLGEYGAEGMVGITALIHYSDLKILELTLHRENETSS